MFRPAEGVGEGVMKGSNRPQPLERDPGHLGSPDNVNVNYVLSGSVV